MMLSIFFTGVSKVLLCTCPNHLNFTHLCRNRGNPSFSPNFRFLISFIIVLSHIHLSIRNFLTSILCSKFSLQANIMFHTAQKAWLRFDRIYLLIYLEASPRWLLVTWANPLVFDEYWSLYLLFILIDWYIDHWTYKDDQLIFYHLICKCNT